MVLSCLRGDRFVARVICHEVRSCVGVIPGDSRRYVIAYVLPCMFAQSRHEWELLLSRLRGNHLLACAFDLDADFVVS